MKSTLHNWDRPHKDLSKHVGKHARRRHRETWMLGVIAVVVALRDLVAVIFMLTLATRLPAEMAVYGLTVICKYL